MELKKIRNTSYSEISNQQTKILNSADYSEFDAVFNNDFQSIIIADLDANILKMNSKFLNSLKELRQTSIAVGSSIYDIISPENLEKFKSDFQKSVSGIKIIDERWLKDVNGLDFCFIYNYTPIKKDGNVIQIMISILDVTGIRATNKIIESHEQHYLALVDGHQAAMFITRPDGSIVQANESATKLFGYTVEEFTKITRHVFIDHTDPRLEIALENREKNGIVKCELTGIKKNGTRFPIEVSSVIFNNTITGEVQISTLILDITNRKRDEKLLHETNIVARVGGWELNLIDNTLFWSDVTKEIHGVPLDFQPSLDMAIGFYKAGENRTRITALINKLIETGEQFDEDFIIVSKNNIEIWVRAKGMIDYFDGKPIRIFGTFQDIDKYKKTVLALQDSENKLSAYFNSTSDAICLIDENYLVIGFNKIFEETILNIWKKKIKIGDSILDYNSTETIEKFKNNFGRALEGLQVSLEREISLNNYHSWWAVLYSPIVTSDKKVIGVAFTSSDISAKKNAEFALKESISKLEKSLNELNHQRFALDQHALVNVTDLEGKIIYVNDKYAELSGYTKDQLIGSTHRLVKSTVHNEQFFREMFETIHGGHVWNGEICNINKSGQPYWLRMTIVPFKDYLSGEVIQFISISSDITSKKIEENQLKLFESVIRNANDAVIITEAEPLNMPGPRIVYVNDAFTKMTGYTKEEVIGKTPRILQGPLSDKNEIKKLSDAIGKWQSYEIELINYTKAGEPFWVNFSVVPIADEKGWFTHWISIQRETSVRRKNDEEKKILIDELSSSIGELKQFTYITSHNMRAPVTNLLGIFNILDTSKISDEFTLQLIDGLKKSTHNLNDTLNDLIKILIVKENTNLPLSTLVFQDILNDVTRSINSLIANSDAKIDADFSAIDSVSFNKSYLESIFLNLITNAIRYSDPKRRLHLKINSYIQNNQIKLKFADNGIGMNMNLVRGQIFGLYKRFHNHSESKGVGLYLVHSQLTALGGFIEVDSKENVGTTFTITFGQVK